MMRGLATGHCCEQRTVSQNLEGVLGLGALSSARVTGGLRPLSAELGALEEVVVR